MKTYEKAFPVLHKLYVTALVIGVSSASCESSFSTLARVLTPYRRTMLHERKKNLVILAHETWINLLPFLPGQTEDSCYRDRQREIKKIKKIKKKIQKKCSLNRAQARYDD